MANTVNTEPKTLEALKAELEKVVSDINLNTDYVRASELEKKKKDLIEAYNNQSLFNTYSTFYKTDCPLLAFAKAFYYPTVGVKAVKSKVPEEIDGTVVMKEVFTQQLDFNKKAEMNVTAFIKWLEQRQTEEKPATASKDWIQKRTALHDTIIKVVKKHEVSQNSLKKAIQAWFDTLIFIQGENGNNAFVATTSQANFVRDTAVTLGKEALSVDILSPKQWDKIQMRLLHSAAVAKDFSYTAYADDDKGTPIKDEPKKKSEAAPADKSKSKSKSATPAAQPAAQQ